MQLLIFFGIENKTYFTQLLQSAAKKYQSNKISSETEVKSTFGAMCEPTGIQKEMGKDVFCAAGFVEDQHVASNAAGFGDAQRRWEMIAGIWFQGLHITYLPVSEMAQLWSPLPDLCFSAAHLSCNTFLPPWTLPQAI